MWLNAVCKHTRLKNTGSPKTLKNKKEAQVSFHFSVNFGVPFIVTIIINMQAVFL